MKKILDSALDLAYDAVAITDVNGYITTANTGLRKLLNLRHTKIIGHHISEIIPELNYKQSLIFNKKIEGELLDIKGKKCIAAQMPVYRNKQKLGAIYKIIFQQLETWKDILLHMDKLEHQLSYYRDKFQRHSKDAAYFNKIISINERMEKLKTESLIAAQSSANILILGESGTGKELFAEGIHQASGRKGAFIKVNCAAIPGELLESEFFGYEEGAFTGAKREENRKI